MAAHPSAAGQKLKVLVTFDPGLSSVRIAVHGRVTSLNLHGLDLIVRRAGLLAPECQVILDLSAAQTSDAIRTELCPRSLDMRLATTFAASSPTNLRVITPISS